MDSTPQPPPTGTPQPPPQPGQPPTQYPPQYPPQGGYPPQGAYQAPPPPVQKKGFNWLACCGITCLVMVILVGGMAFCTYRMVQPFMSMGLEMDSISQNVKSANLDTIKSEAITVTPSELAANTSLYQGQWLRLEGEIAMSGGMGNSSFSFGEFNTENYTSYMMEGNIVVLDTSGRPSMGGVGDPIVAYGQCYSWDMQELEKIPFVGKLMVEEMKKEPELAGNMKMVFFIAKEVERTGTATEDSASDDGDVSEGDTSDNDDSAADVSEGDDSGSDSGWLR